MTVKPIIKVKLSGIKKAREAGAEIVKLYLDASTHSPYEGKQRRHARDYFYGYLARTDNHDLLCLVK
jgi:hypothetical protein